MTRTTVTLSRATHPGTPTPAPYAGGRGPGNAWITNGTEHHAEAPITEAELRDFETWADDGLVIATDEFEDPEQGKEWRLAKRMAAEVRRLRLPSAEAATMEEPSKEIPEGFAAVGLMLPCPGCGKGISFMPVGARGKFVGGVMSCRKRSKHPDGQVIDVEVLEDPAGGYMMRLVKGST